MYIKRHLENQIIKASEDYPVVMVCGQRQVGKSTMLYHIKEDDRRYVTLDDGNARRLASQDPALFFETYSPPLLIDEFQKVPDILLEMKNIIDRKALEGEDTRGMFWITGSQKFKMMKDVAKSLAGRIAIFDMSSLSAAEIEGRPSDLFRPDIDALKTKSKYAKKKDVGLIYEEIFRGGMPKLRSSSIEKDRYYMDYVNTYIERDIKGLAQVGKPNEFYDFLVYMASHTGQGLKYDDISNTVNISSPTAKTWVSILERSGIIFILRPYHSNVTKRMVKTPKIYFMDTGLASYLCRWPNGETIQNGIMAGAFLETYVVSEIVKSYFNCGKQTDLFYYRDIDKKEVDLLISEGDRLYPIEIKKSKQPENADKNFGVLKKLGLDIRPGIILCLSDELVPYNRDSWYCPISLI